MANFAYPEGQIKNILRRIITQFRNKNSEDELVKQTKKIFTQLVDKRTQAGVKMYHSTRFAFIQQAGYFTTKNSNDLKKAGQEMQIVYQKIKEIFNKLEKQIGLEREDNIGYAVYYKDGDTVKRASMNQIPSVRKGSRKQLKTAGLQSYLKGINELQNNDIKILDIGQHFQSFIGVIQASYKGKGDIPNRVISYGRLAEAFQMHLQSNLNHNMNDAPPWNYNQVWMFLRRATANVPWYLTGDVGGTQVKSIITGDVRLTSKSTFQNTLNFLNYLLNANDDIEQAVNNAYNVLVVQLNQTENNTIKNLAHQTIEQALQNQKLDELIYQIF